MSRQHTEYVACPVRGSYDLASVQFSRYIWAFPGSASARGPLVRGCCPALRILCASHPFGAASGVKSPPLLRASGVWVLPLIVGYCTPWGVTRQGVSPILLLVFLIVL